MFGGRFELIGQEVDEVADRKGATLDERRPQLNRDPDDRRNGAVEQAGIGITMRWVSNTAFSITRQNPAVSTSVVGEQLSPFRPGAVQQSVWQSRDSHQKLSEQVLSDKQTLAWAMHEETDFHAHEREFGDIEA